MHRKLIIIRRSSEKNNEKIAQSPLSAVESVTIQLLVNARYAEETGNGN